MFSYICTCGFRNNWMGSETPPACRRCGQRPTNEGLDSLHQKVEEARRQPFGSEDDAKNELRDSGPGSVEIVATPDRQEPTASVESFSPDLPSKTPSAKRRSGKP